MSQKLQKTNMFSKVYLAVLRFLYTLDQVLLNSKGLKGEHLEIKFTLKIIYSAENN